MKTLLRGLGPAFLVGTFLGFVGCAPDNESEAQRNQAKLGAPPTTDVKSVDDSVPLRNQQDLAERRKKQLAQDPSKTQRSGGGAERPGVAEACVSHRIDFCVISASSRHQATGPSARSSLSRAAGQLPGMVKARVQAIRGRPDRARAAIGRAGSSSPVVSDRGWILSRRI